MRHEGVSHTRNPHTKGVSITDDSLCVSSCKTVYIHVHVSGHVVNGMLGQPLELLTL